METEDLRITDVGKKPTTKRCNFCVFFDYTSKDMNGMCSKHGLEVKRTNVCPDFKYDLGLGKK